MATVTFCSWSVTSYRVEAESTWLSWYTADVRLLALASYTTALIPSEGHSFQPSFKTKIATDIPHWNVEKVECTGKNEALHSNWQRMRMASWNNCVHPVSQERWLLWECQQLVLVLVMKKEKIIGQPKKKTWQIFTVFQKDDLFLYYFNSQEVVLSFIISQLPYVLSI